jgi:predicted AAA+ superfamily ATPase
VDFLWDCVLKCGYPEVYQKSLEPGRFYADYLATYLQRDVRRVLNVKNLRLFDRFLRLLASQSGQLLSVNRIANDLGVSATTLREWVDVFEVTNIVRRLEPWSINVRKRVVKTPKLFFLDTGILCHLLGIETMAQLKSSPMLGQIFESFVFAEFLKNQWNRSKKPEVYFYRDYAQKEVDFVLHSGISLSLF